MEQPPINAQLLPRAARALWKRGRRGAPEHLERNPLFRPGPAMLFSRAAEQVLEYTYGPRWPGLLRGFWGAGQRGEKVSYTGGNDARAARRKAREARKEAWHAARRDMNLRQKLNSWQKPQDRSEEMLRPDLAPTPAWEEFEEDDDGYID